MRVCCVEDQMPTQVILEQLIQEVHPNCAISLFSNTSEALSFLSDESSDFIITDLDFKGNKQLDIIEYAAKHDIPCIVYSAHSDAGFINSAFHSGAKAFVSKFASMQQLKKVISLWDQLYPKLGTHWPNSIINVDRDNSTPLQLNNRDEQILKMVIRGVRREDIAKTMNLSVHSVNTYIRNMCSDYNCKKEELIHRFLLWKKLSD